MEVDIVESGKLLTGELRSLDQGNAKLKLAEIKLDEKRFGFTIPQLAANFSGKLSKKGTVAKGTFTQNGVQLPLTLKIDDVGAGKPEASSKETLREAWIGELNMGLMKPLMQFRIVTLASGTTSAYFDSITEGRTGFKATWSIDGDELKFDVAQINLKYRGKLNEAGDTAEGTWSQGGREVPLTLQKKATEHNSVNVWGNRPQRPVGPFPYDAEDVTFENQADGVTLAGTLTIPKNPGKHPVVVLISGSGAQDRDETLLEHKPFLVLADYLSRHGIAVLRYDDRGTNQSTGSFSDATTEDFARDASAAVEFLKRHDRINPAEIGLAGHSEGGLIAPMVVALRTDVAFIVLLAATGVDGVTISESQTQAMLKAEGTDESEIEIAMTINRAVIEAAMSVGPGEDFADQIQPVIDQVMQKIPESDREEAAKNIGQGITVAKQQMKSKWMRFFLAYDPRPALTKIQCPVLVISGSKDLQVLPDLNMPEIEKALATGGNKDFEIVVLEGLNHLFQECETGSMSEYVAIQETFNPVALEKIGDWIVKRTTPVQ